MRKIIQIYPKALVIIKLRLVTIVLSLVALFFTALGQSAVLIKEKQWQKGMTLKVVFLDGSDQLKQLIKQTAPQWLEKTSLSFQFFDNLSLAPKSTHIRISFKLHSGSELGNHGEYLLKTPTMNLFDLTTGKMSASASRRLILHEFGHALGFEHEYRSQYWPYDYHSIDQITIACYPKMELIGYSKLSAIAHCKEINAPVDPDKYMATAYDEFSIMNYPMSVTLSSGDTKQIKASTKLSYLDQHAIQQWY